MSPSDDFYALISSLLQQAAQNPELPPEILLERYPAGSPEQILLGNLRSALAALQTTGKPHPTQAVDTPWHYRSIFDSASDGLIINDVETGRVLEVNPAACRMYGYARDEFIGLYPDSFIHPDRSHLFEKYVEVVQSKGVYEGLQVHQRRDGSQFYAELSGSLYADQGCSYILSVVRDVSQRVQSEQLLHQRVEARTREQTTLLEISQTLASALELQPGLILDQLRVIIDYTHAGLFTLEDSTLVALAVRGTQRLEQAMPFHIRLENSETLAALFNGHRPIRIADVQSSDRQQASCARFWNDQASILLEGVQSWMWVPLAVKGRMIGAIGVAHTERNYFHGPPCRPGSERGQPGRDHHGQCRTVRACADAGGAGGTPAPGAQPARCRQPVTLLRRSDCRSPAAPVGAGSGGGTPLAGGFAPLDTRRAGRNAPAAGRAAALRP